MCLAGLHLAVNGKKGCEFYSLSGVRTCNASQLLSPRQRPDTPQGPASHPHAEGQWSLPVKPGHSGRAHQGCSITAPTPQAVVVSSFSPLPREVWSPDVCVPRPGPGPSGGPQTGVGLRPPGQAALWGVPKSRTLCAGGQARHGPGRGRREQTAGMTPRSPKARPSVAPAIRGPSLPQASACWRRSLFHLSLCPALRLSASEALPTNQMSVSDTSLGRTTRGRRQRAASEHRPWRQTRCRDVSHTQTAPPRAVPSPSAATGRQAAIGTNESWTRVRVRSHPTAAGRCRTAPSRGLCAEASGTTSPVEVTS